MPESEPIGYATFVELALLMTLSRKTGLSIQTLYALSPLRILRALLGVVSLRGRRALGLVAATLAMTLVLFFASYGASSASF